VAQLRPLWRKTFACDKFQLVSAVTELPQLRIELSGERPPAMPLPLWRKAVACDKLQLASAVTELPQRPSVTDTEFQCPTCHRLCRSRLGLQSHSRDKSKSKSNDNFYIAHISISRMLTAQGVYIQMYRGRPCRGFEPRSPVYQSAALTSRPNPRPSGKDTDASIIMHNTRIYNAHFSRYKIHSRCPALLESRDYHHCLNQNCLPL
jgi:hypothetical protein